MKKSKNLIVTDVTSFFSKEYNLKVHVETVHEKERKFICLSKRSQSNKLHTACSQNDYM